MMMGRAVQKLWPPDNHNAGGVSINCDGHARDVFGSFPVVGEVHRGVYDYQKHSRRLQSKLYKYVLRIHHAY